MVRFRVALLLVVLVAVWGAGVFIAPVSSEECKDREFVGVDKCKMCHKKPDQGEQYTKWLEGPHSKAYETLANDKSKEIAKGLEIENPQEADECLKCHVTAHGVKAELLGKKHKIEDGVGCESCHGAGGDYFKMSTMKKLAAGEIEPASVGLIEPDEKLCITCHNEESPTYKEFVFEERVKQIAHPIPKKAE
jgi:hypothetical protein